MLKPSDMATEFYNGKWNIPEVEGPEPLAIVTYTDEPSPETGHAGWCWWSLGKMGEAASYHEACAQAVAALPESVRRELGECPGG